MSKLSIIIPSRDERFLTPTIDDIFRNARDEETEVIAVLDSDKWPGNWKEVTARHPRLHTIHNGQSIGMRGSINKGVASAISRGAKFIAKFDGHCSFSEGFDEVLKADCDEDWIVVPRRGRLDPENWCPTDTHKLYIDYHYLSFPDDPNDFGGPGLNGKIWPERALERNNVLVDDEMSSQGSGWFMHVSYFQRLELMDEASYGPFWCEFQELGLKCWLSGGQVKVNKKCKYLHLHKGSKYGRGYRLAESALVQGRNQTMKWIWNEAWNKQTLPFKWLIEHFWPVPSWPENWEEVLYAERKPRAVGSGVETVVRDNGMATGAAVVTETDGQDSGLRILSARYGILGSMPPFSEHSIDVVERVRSLVKNDSLDIVVNNSMLCSDQNPFRGKKKVLLLTYSYGGDEITIERIEKEWLIIGQARRDVPATWKDKANQRWPQGVVEVGMRDVIESPEIHYEVHDSVDSDHVHDFQAVEGQSVPQCKCGAVRDYEKITAEAEKLQRQPMSATALNDYLIRKFSISPQRLRGPMPIELRDFHRNDLAALFAELGFKRGAEIGVAEGKYSEVLLKANPECELLLVDPWHHYSDNPQGKSKEKHEFAYNEAYRRTQTSNSYAARMIVDYSMNAVRDVKEDSLDFCYIDGNHLFDFVIQDLIEWSKRVRSGGIVSGDDYYALDQKRWIGGGVVEAVQAYTNAHRIPIWYIFEGRKSTDFMWVKP